MKQKTLSIIVAVANQNAIGNNNSLLCHLPGDLKRFKNITMGHTLIMGRRTWESLPVKPLPGRRNIVLTDIAGENFQDAETCRSIEHAIALCPEGEESFIIGGASVYTQFLPLCHKLYLTRIFHDFEADAFFPEIPEAEWTELNRETIEPSDNNPYAFAFITYLRKTN
jgi:dihydrofolate reductase